jgi:hypothetical protein
VAFLSIEEQAKVWNSLDDNLRQQVTSGKLTLEQAASYVVPIGDRQLERMSQGPQAARIPPPGLDAEPVGPPAARNSAADSFERAKINAKMIVPTLTEALNTGEMLLTDKAAAIQRGEAEAFTSDPYIEAANRAKLAANDMPGANVGGLPVGPVNALSKFGLDALGIAGTQTAAALAASTRSQESLLSKREQSTRDAFEQVESLTALRNELAKLPENLASKEFIEAVDSGNWFTASTIVQGGQAAFYLGLENSPTLAAQAAATAATAAITRNPTAIRTVAAVTGGLGEATEISSDYMDVLSRMSPEEQADPAARFNAFKTAAASTMARMAVGAAIPSGAGGAASTGWRSLGKQLVLQPTQEMLGEAAASEVRDADYTAGSLLLEGIAGVPAVVTEGGGQILSDRNQAKLRTDLTKSLQQQADEATADLIRTNARREADQVLAEANREQFDAEIEADRALEELRLKTADAEALNRGDQMEMPFGSDLAGDPAENDRTPTVKDMFTGESVAATKAEQQRAANAEEAGKLAKGERTLTEDEFELQSQRTTAAKDSIDNRKQDDFEQQKQKEADRRALLAEDQTILKNERQLQSTADITREAERRLEIEKEEIRRKPENRRGIRNAKLGETLEAYERKRKPELVAQVREERLARIVKARDRTIAEENRLIAQDEIDVQNDLDSRSEARLKDEQEAAKITDLFSTPQAKGQMDLLPGEVSQQPNRPTYTGTLTEKQAQQEAAALLLARQKAREKTRPEQEAKQRKLEEDEAREIAEAIDAELPTVQKALDEATTKAASLTAKSYAKKEKDAINAAMKAAMDKPGATAESVKVDIAAALAEWRKANPRPATVPAPTTGKLMPRLVKLAEQVQAEKERGAKAAETKSEKRALRREIDSGKTPEEAAESVGNRTLTKEEDAELRAQLGDEGVKPSPVNSPKPRRYFADTVRATQGDAVWAESAGLRAAVDAALASKAQKPGDLLRAIIAHKDASRGEKWLASRLVGLVDNLNIKLVAVPDPELDPQSAGWGGAFNPASNTLWVRAATAEVILHEVLHAVTANVIRSKIARNNPKVKSAVQQLEDVRAAASLVYARDQKLITGRLATVLANKQGPLSNTAELISYGLTDDDFMAWLESIPMEGNTYGNYTAKKSAWQGFKDAIKTIFTPRNEYQNNALDEILDATSALIEEQEKEPFLNARATTELILRAGRARTAPDPQSISGLRGNMQARESTLAKSLSAIAKTYKNVAKALSATTRNEDNPLNAPEFRSNAFDTPLKDMADRTIEDGDVEAYRRARNSFPRELARWSGAVNRLIMPDGTLMALFHGSKVTADVAGKSFSAFRLPQDSGQLGIHATVAPQVATTFNNTDSQSAMLNSQDDALYVMAGRMSNPLRLTDYGLWDAQAVLASIKDRPEPEYVGLRRSLESIIAQEAARQIDDQAVRDAILAAGFDGVVYLNRMEMGMEYGVRNAVAPQRLDKLGIPLVPITEKAPVIKDTAEWLNWQVWSTINQLSDEDFKRVFPEAAESYIFLRQSDIKAVESNSGEFSESPDIYASDAGDVEVGEKFTNPTSKQEFFGPRGLLRPELKQKGRLVEALFDAVSAGGGRIDYNKGIRSSIAEIFERASSEAGSLIAEAEGLFKAMDTALYKVAKRAGKDPDALRTQFSKDIAEFEGMAEGLTKSAAAKKLADTYGKAANGYFRARAKIDSLSNEILQQRLSDPRPFTEEEARTYTSIKENLGRYYTRTYAANTKGIGTKRAKKLWGEYSNVAEGSENPDFRDGYDIVRNAIMFISKSHLIVPDIDILEDMSVTDLKDMAAAWGISVEGIPDIDNPITSEMTKASLIEQLEKFRDATPEVRQSRAKVLVEELLFSKTHAALNRFYRGQSQDRTIVKERKAVPDEIRKLLGEYEDLPLRAMTTIIRMATFRSTNKAFKELLEKQEGTTILSQEDFTASGNSTQEWKQVKSESYGPLDGMWVRKDLLNNVESSVEIVRTFDQMIGMGEHGSKERVLRGLSWLGDKWIGFAATVKMLQLVANSANAGLNYGGGVVAMVGNGNLNPNSVVKAHKIATSLIASQVSSHMSDDMLKVIRSGITDSALLGSIRKVEAEKLNEVLFSHLETKSEKTRSSINRKVAGAGRMWRETYAMADVVWKIANFLEEERKLTEFYKAEGIEMSAESIEREAAWRVNQSNFSYKRVPNFIKDIEKGGITYVMPYIYETFRAPAGSLFVGLADFAKASKATTPKGRALMVASGIKRVGGSLLAMGAVQMAMYTAVQMIAGISDEEEEWTNKLRAFMPDYKKFADLIYLGDNEDGQPVVLEFSRLDPFGPSTEFFRMAMAGAEPEEYLEATKNLLIGNPYGRGIFQALVGQSSTRTRTQDISPELYDRMVQVFSTGGLPGPRLAKAVDILLPSAIVRPFDPNNKPVDDEIFTRMFTILGGQLHNINPKKSIEFAAAEFSGNQRDVRDRFMTILKTRTHLTDESLLSEMSQLREDEQQNFQKLQDLHDGALELGYPRDKLFEQLKQQGISTTNLTMLNMGGYVPQGSGIVSVRGLKQSWSMVNNSSAQPATKQTYYNNILRTLQLVESGQIPARE